MAKVNNELWDMSRPITENCRLDFLDFSRLEGKEIFWRSSAHLLAYILQSKFNIKVCSGKIIEDGFYYDFEGKIAESDYPEIINSIIAESVPFERLEISRDEAIELFKDKLEKIPDSDKCIVYKYDSFIDLSDDPYLSNSSQIAAFELISQSSVNCLKNNSLQRIYAISFPSKKQLDEWKDVKKLAAEQDHRVIGKAQELYMFHP